MVCSRLSIGLFAALALPVAVTAQDALTQKLLRIAGLTAAPSQPAAPAVAVAANPGNIWVVPADRGAPKALTLDGGYTSPIFSPDGRVYALKGDTLVRLPQETGAGVAVHKVPRAVKLVGFDGSNADELVVLVDAGPGASPLASVSLRSGRVTPLAVDPASEAHQRILAQIRAQERTYGTTRVSTRAHRRDSASRTTQSSDVFVRSGAGAARNASACNGAPCAEPALSPDGRSIVFIKAGK
jgi:hypothetical protein